MVVESDARGREEQEKKQIGDKGRWERKRQKHAPVVVVSQQVAYYVGKVVLKVFLERERVQQNERKTKKERESHYSLSLSLSLSLFSLAHRRSSSVSPILLCCCFQ